MSVELDNIIQLIKNAKLPGENTAVRVGTSLELLNSEKANKSESFTKSQTLDLINQVKALAATGTEFVGTIMPDTPPVDIPDGDIWAFAQAGTYANAGGVTIPSGSLGILTRIGNVWSATIVEVDVNSIEDIEKTNTVGLVDTYTITMTNGSTFDFEVRNGASSNFSITSNESGSQFGYFSDGNIVLEQNYKSYQIDNSYKDLKSLKLYGSKIDSTAPQAYIAGVKENGTWVAISPPSGGNDLNTNYDLDFTLYTTIYVTFYIGSGAIQNPTVISTRVITMTSFYEKFNFIASKIVPKLSVNNSTKTNSSILQAAILEGWNSLKSIDLPEGEYYVENVQWLPVNMFGKDRNTILKSETANPIFIGHPGQGTDIVDGRHIPNALKNKYVGCEQGKFILWGKNVGTYGMDLGAMAYANMQRIVCYGFTEAGIRTKGMLVSNWYDLNIRLCKNGIQALDGFHNPESYYSNLVTFSTLRLNEISGIGVDWKMGAGITITDLDAEECGTINDSNTGIVRLSQLPSDYPKNSGIKLYGAWGERNHGGFYLKNDTTATCVVRDSDFLLHGTAQKCLVNNGGKLVIDTCNIEPFSVAVETNGSNALTLVQGICTIPNHTELNGGQYKVIN